nr:MAG TPA: hypothetical protein [Caudoviricetes sp.]
MPIKKSAVVAHDILHECHYPTADNLGLFNFGYKNST